MGKWMEKEKMMGLGNISRPSSLVMVVFVSVVVTSCCSIIAAEDGTCEASGNLPGTNPPPGKCNQENNSECCKDGVSYPLFSCSPPVTEQTAAKLTLNSFEEGGDGGGPSKCDQVYHKDDELVVALSTGWFRLDNNKRCQKSIMIFGNGNSVKATVVDECDSTTGCDEDHDFQPPCGNNVVDASKAVWDALGVPEGDRGELDIEWSDA